MDRVTPVVARFGARAYKEVNAFISREAEMRSPENGRFYDDDADAALVAGAPEAPLHGGALFTPAQVAFPEILAARAVDRELLAARAARTAVGIALVCGGVFLVFCAASGFQAAHAVQVILGTWAAAV